MISSNSELNKIINRLLITNFIKNSKYINLIEPLLNDSHIELKDIDNYNDKEVSRVVKLINDIIFCQKTNNHNKSLFFDINDCLENNLSVIKQRRKSKSNDKDYWSKYANKFIRKYYKDYEIMFNNYNKRKAYLKYF